MSDVVEVGAAYLYYLASNHPFVDGNKRVAFVTCLTFLRLNGINMKPDSSAWEKLVLDVAASLIDREQTTHRLRELVLST